MEFSLYSGLSVKSSLESADGSSLPAFFQAEISRGYRPRRRSLPSSSVSEKTLYCLGALRPVVKGRHGQYLEQRPRLTSASSRLCAFARDELSNP